VRRALTLIFRKKKLPDRRFNLMPERQSAYRQYHNTETAVTKVHSDLLLAADEGDVSAPCLRVCVQLRRIR